MDKENIDPIPSSLDRIILPSSRQVPSILRRRRRSQTSIVPDSLHGQSITSSPLQKQSIASPLRQKPCASPLQKYPISPALRKPPLASPLKPRNDRQVATPSANVKRPSDHKRNIGHANILPEVLHEASTGSRQTAVELVPVLQNAGRQLQLARKRHYEMLINSKERTNILDKSGRMYQHSSSEQMSRKRTKWVESATLGEVSRRNVTLSRGFEIAKGLQQLVSGTSQVLKYLLEQAEEETNRSKAES